MQEEMEDKDMANNRANKYKDTTKEISRNAVRFDLIELDLICNYILSDNANIRRSNINNVKKLMEYMDMSLYADNKEALKRIEFIIKGANIRLNQHIDKKDMIIRSINGGFGTAPSNVVTREITDLEVDWINQTVSECLRYLVIASKAEEGIAILTKFLSTDYRDRGNIVGEMEEFVKQFNNEFRRTKVETSDDQVFNLNTNQNGMLIDAYAGANNTYDRLQFGSIALNTITGGGVYNGRTYLLLGLPGEGKSSTLLDMALQIKKYNKNYICRDKTKKPCVVLFVMENSIRETIERMFSMVTRKDMREVPTIEEALEMFRKSLSITPDDPIDVIIKYRPNLSEDTSYLYTIYDDLADEGYEVICMIQDYIKRIRSVEGSFGGDLRMQMGAIMNEFKTFATLKNIPVITASQLNRTASSSIDEARVKNKNDLVRLIGRSNVGESNLIIENADWVGLLAPEEDDEEIRYLGLNRVKSRYYISGEQVVFAPYVLNTIKLVEDMDAEMPSMKLSLRDKEFEDNMAYRSGSMNSKKIMECIEKGDPIKLVNGSFEISVGSQANKDKKEDESMVLEGDEQVVDFNTLIGEKVVRGVAGFYARNIVIRVQEMCKIIDNSRKRELCKIVSR
jgi:dnaB-like helicase C terminal domain